MSLPLARRPLGATGLEVTVLGFGAMQIGSPEVDDRLAGTLLNTALDLGITLIDTARSYGLSEERVGRHLAHRRHEFVLSTKVGYGVDGVEDWTPRCVTLGVEQARARLRTDVIDIVHLHSCDAATLMRPGLIEALEQAISRGVVRVAAYSGDNEAAGAAVDSGRFGVLQTSLNLCDQRSLPLAARCPEGGIGVLAKRPLAGLSWQPGPWPTDPAHVAYRERFATLHGIVGERDWAPLALRFAAFAPGISACLVGGTNPAHLEANARAAACGALPAAEYALLTERFLQVGTSWPGLI